MKGFAPLLVLLAWPLLGAGGDAYRFERPVDAAAGLSVLELPDDVLDVCRPGLADLRLLKDADQEIPYAFERHARITTKRVPLVDVESQAGRDTTAIADRGAGPGLAGWLSVETPSTNFLKPVVVEASDDRKTWKTIGHSSLFAMEALRMTTVRFAPTDRRYLRLTLDDRNGAPVQPAAMVLPLHESRFPAPREIRLPAAAVTPREAGRSMYSVTLPARNLALSALRIEASDPIFSREARVYEKVFVRDEISRRLLGEGRLIRSAAGETQDRIVVSDASARTIEIDVEDGDSPPLSVPEVRALVEPRRIVFYRPAAGALSLAYGSDAARVPAYDLEAAFAGGLPDELPRASVGTAKDHGAHAGVVAPPARGTSLDRSRWRRSSPILLPDTPGVAYLELDGALAADASSLRIVDGGGLQVPYVFEDGAHRVRQTIGFDVVRKASHTVVRVGGLDVRERIDAIAISVGGPAYFARDVAVVEDVRDARGVTEQRVLGTAHWERRPDEHKAPYRIALASPREGTVQIDIDDGDNSPLTIESAALEILRRRIDFVFERGDAFRMLSDNPEALPPRYDLALLATAVLASPALPATLGAVAEAPSAKQPASRWFWVAVVVAGGLVSLALARTLRSLP